MRPSKSIPSEKSKGEELEAPLHGGCCEEVLAPDRHVWAFLETGEESRVWRKSILRVSHVAITRTYVMGSDVAVVVIERMGFFDS